MQISPSSLKLKPLSLTKKYKDTRYITIKTLIAENRSNFQPISFLGKVQDELNQLMQLMY